MMLCTRSRLFVYSGIILVFHVFATLEKGDILNQCANNKRRKQSPSASKVAYSFCQQWQKRSCCTADTTVSINFHGRQKLDGEKWDVCGNFSLSYRCKMMFRYESCFSECEPNLGPWIINRKSTSRQEFRQIPICASSCELWYSMCKFDLTCAKDWYTDMIWTPSGNRCPQGTKCQTYSDMYGSGKAFCENIRGSTYKYVADNKKCLLLMYHSMDNPNTKVVQQMFHQNTTNNQTSTIVTNPFYNHANDSRILAWSLLSSILLTLFIFPLIHI